MKTLIVFLFLLVTQILFTQNIEIELFKSGFTNPLDIQHANDDRLFVAEQGGKIRIIKADGTVNAIPFIDIAGLISNGGERGLLGFAFHPDYSSNGYFFFNYTNLSGDTQVSRFTVNSSNPDLADLASELPIIDYVQPLTNHNGGCLAFGPDGYLYISSGDGGGSGDPENRAQNKLLPLGKILRLDIDNPSGGNNYSVPADNPFVGDPNGLDEIWAYGLRNPWRFSFDFTENNLWIADVGQQNVEEINRQPSTEAGLNYGWRCYEGSQTFNTTGGCPPTEDLTFPFAEYPHTNGNCSITGGYVYSGAVYTDIAGLYFFADLCSGMIGTVDGTGNLIDHGEFSGRWVSFGEDINKELYIVSLDGEIFKIKGSVTANIEEFSIDKALSFYPNPASNSVLFSLKNDLFVNIAIFDTRGSLIISEENISVNEKSISVSGLSSGVYFAKITSAKGQTTVKKLMVQ